MKKIGIVANQEKAGAVELVSKLHEWLAKREASVQDTFSASVDEVVRGADLIVCLGGDGTILNAAGQMMERSVPVLGVNLGRVGFLTEVKQDEVFEELGSFFLDQSAIEERLMLSCTARRGREKSGRRFLALNDIVISREGLSRMLQVEVKISGETLTRYSGDGVIVATPTGSTAYSLSAGGAVVHPKLEALIVTPVCPHSSALRSMVVGADEKIAVRIVPYRDHQKALLTVDGQTHLEIDETFHIEMTRSSLPLKLIKSSKRSFIMTLGENFKFPS